MMTFKNLVKLMFVATLVYQSPANATPEPSSLDIVRTYGEALMKMGRQTVALALNKYIGSKLATSLFTTGERKSSDVTQVSQEQLDELSEHFLKLQKQTLAAAAKAEAIKARTAAIIAQHAARTAHNEAIIA